MKKLVFWFNQRKAAQKGKSLFKNTLFGSHFQVNKPRERDHEKITFW